MPDMAPVWTQRIAKPLLELPRRQKRVLMLAADLVCIPAALWTAITLKSGTAAHSITDDGWLYLAALLATVPVFARLGLYRAVLRFMGPKALTAVVVGVTLSVILLLLVNYFALGARIQISTFVIYWALALIYVGGSRLVVRSVVHYQRHGANRVAIYGAGAAGAQVADALVRSGRYYPVAFVDDNKGLHGSIINGIEVFSPEDIPQLIEQDGLSTVLLALPSLSRRRRHEILQVLEPLEVHVQTVPDIDDIVNGNARVEDIRDVDVNDLLGRDPVPPDEQLLDACIRGKIVMVTGAGGSRASSRA